VAIESRTKPIRKTRPTWETIAAIVALGDAFVYRKIEKRSRSEPQTLETTNAKAIAKEETKIWLLATTNGQTELSPILPISYAKTRRISQSFHR
jgi:hypothetical protein